MKAKLLRLIDKLLGPVLRRHYEVPSMEWSLRNMHRLGFDPRFIIDIGAFHGEWTTMVRQEFPAASFLMLEAQEGKRAVLEGVKAASQGKADYRIAVMGPEDGKEAVFHEYENSPTASSMLQDHADTETKKVPTRLRSLDAILLEGGFPRPDFIKLDVQGFELEVLKGGTEALSSAQAVLMEVSIIELYQGSPLLDEVNAFMARHRFRTYDICSLLRRPLDQALCQVDIIYLKEGSPLFGRKTWI